MGLAADVGTLARLPKVIGSQSLVRELCYTCRKLGAEEAERCGFVSGVYKDRDRYRLIVCFDYLLGASIKYVRASA